MGKQLDKVVMDTIRGFAESKGMTLTDDEEISKTLGNMSKQMCMQLNEMIVKQFKAMEIINHSAN